MQCRYAVTPSFAAATWYWSLHTRLFRLGMRLIIIPDQMVKVARLLASSPGSLAGIAGEGCKEREPGTHCLHMH